jgi:small multidrug resistance family-3 protein
VPRGCTRDACYGHIMETTLSPLRVFPLFVLTACAEIVGCYLPYLWLRKEKPMWLLLTLHPTAAGRTYAAYGGVYVATAIAWLWLVEGQRPDRWDIIGAAVSIFGMVIVAFGPRPPAPPA